MEQHAESESGGERMLPIGIKGGFPGMAENEAFGFALNYGLKIVSQAARATLAATMSFPEVVSQLMPTGAEYYHADYVAMRKTFYNADGDTVVTPINYEGLPKVAEDFDVQALMANILDNQTKNQKYFDFTRRAMEAGVQGYFAFLRGKRVTYFGRQGDAHTEWFPGAGPNNRP